MTPVETVARAITAEMGHDPDAFWAGRQEGFEEHAWKFFVEEARVAIAALSPPSPAMVEAGAEHLFLAFGSTMPWNSLSKAAKDKWRTMAAGAFHAMLAAAIKDGGGE